MSRSLRTMLLVALLALPGTGLAAETAIYDGATTYNSPRCFTGASPCVVPSALINSRGTMAPAEPHQPNTLSTSPCADGASGSYHGDESLDSFTVESPSAAYLSPGGTVNLTATVWCYGPTDTLTIYRADYADVPVWGTPAAQATCPVSGQSHTFVLSFNMGEVITKQAIRVQFTYGAATSACTVGAYNDRDDLVLSTDQDGDGMPSDWESNYGACLNYTISDANLDPDNDGLTNLEEYQNRTNPCVADMDGGGEPDGWEISAGRDPLIPFDDQAVRSVGAGSLTGLTIPLRTASHDARTQAIYLASEIGSAGLIESVALDVTGLPGQVMNNFTIRLKHTVLSAYATSAWEGPSSGWSTAYQNNETISHLGWHLFKLQTPFYYNGTDNLMVDLSFNNASASSNGTVRYTNLGTNRTIWYSTNSAYGDPLNWVGTSNPPPSTTTNFPNLRLQLNNDRDHDGIPDWFEIARGLNPDNPDDALLDSDADGLNNWEEYYFGTDPHLADTDSDGLSDYQEIFVTLTDPLNPDTDGDGIPDGWEIDMGLDALFNDADADADDDGLSNAEEYFADSDPLFPNHDDDRDALANDAEDNTTHFVDVSHTGTSPLLADTDGGGELDGLEAFLGRDPNDSADDKKWSAFNITYSGNGYDELNPAIGISDAGTVILAYEYSGNTPPIRFRIWSGSAWGANAGVTGAATTAHNPIFRRSPVTGVLHLFWQESDVGATQWRLRHAYLAGASFTAAETLVTETNEAFQTYDVQFAGDGAIFADWVSHSGSDYTLRYGSSAFSWGSGSYIDSSTTQITKVGIAVDFRGAPSFIWGFTGTDNGIMYKKKVRRTGPDWDATVTLGTGSSPSLVIDRSGNFYAAWKQGPNIYTAVHDYRGWQESVNLSNSLAVCSSPQLTNDYFGNVNLFWNEQAGTLNLVRASMVYNGAFLAPIPVRLAQDSATPPTFFSSDSAKDGTLWLLFQEIYPGGADTENTYARLIDYPDTDGDLVNDRTEFIIGSDYQNPDTDGDGLTDGNELRTLKSNPLTVDTDRDGLNDNLEASYSASPILADSDTGTEQDGLEVYLGRNPNNHADDVTWSAQTVASTGGGPALVAPDIASTYSGTNLWAGVYINFSTNALYYAAAAGSPPSFAAGTVIYTDPTYDLDYSRVAYGPGTNVNVVFERNDTTTVKDVWYMVKVSSTWSSPVNITSCSPYHCRAPEIAVTSNGYVHVVYEHASAATGGVGDIYYKFYNGSVWSSPVNLSNTSSATEELPVIAIGPDGTIHVAWSDGSYGNKEIAYVANSGSGWSAKRRLSQTAASSVNPTVAGGYDGKAFITWLEADTAADKYHLLFRTGKDTDWSLAVNPLESNPAGFDPRHLNSASFLGTTYFLTFVATGPTATTYWGTVYIVPYDGKKWRAPFLINYTGGESGSYLRHPRIAFDNIGNPTVLYNWRGIGTGSSAVYRRSLYYASTDADSISDFQEFYLGTSRSLVDTDGDGLNDNLEPQYLTDPTLADTDGDGINDYQEAVTYTTDPGADDSDNDKIPDRWEIIYGLNPNLANGNIDSDGDGLNNFQEFVNHTDPLDNDTDNDGIPDGWEVAHGLNPFIKDDLADDDGDGLNNYNEFLQNTEPQDPDTDNDGMPDGWEVANTLNPKVNDAFTDSDFDGLLNITEYTIGTNPKNYDTDGDLIPDGWEAMRGLNPLVNDAAANPDADGLTNYQEYLANTDPHNADTDGDGMPDGWEVTYQLNPLTNDASGDPDGDGLNNLGEYTRGTNPKNADTDGDGATDNAEIVATTNPLVADTDGDGMLDGYELARGCLNAKVADANGDPDGDSLTNLNEKNNGTNPCGADTDGDGMPDGWEVTYALNPLSNDAAQDPDFDGLTNLTEYQQGRNPKNPEAVPSSRVTIAATITNAASVTVGYTCTDAYAVVHLWKNRNGGAFADTGLTQTGLAGSFNYSFPVGQDGTYGFYSIAVLSAPKTEAAPAVADDTIYVDRAIPVMTSAVDDGAYQTSTNSLHVLFGGTDQGQSGQNTFEYAIGTAAYPSAGCTAVVGWRADADGVVTHMFGSTVLSQGVTYYLSGRLKDNANNYSTPLSSNGITIDTSAPGAVTVTDDGTYSGFTDRMHATWSGGSDPTSGLDHYEYAIGSGIGLTDVVGWTAVGTQTNMTRYGLALNETQLYYVGVKAVNGSGLATIGWSNGIMVDSAEPVLTASAPAQREIVNDSMPPLSSLSFSLHFSDLGGSGISYGAGNPAVVLDFDPVPGWTRSGDTITFGLWGGHTLGLGNHVVSVQLTDRAGNELTQNVIFTVEDPRRVFINPVAAAWKPGQPNLAFYEDGGFGPYHWTTTAGTLNVVNGHTVSLTPTADPGSYVLAVSDSHLVSAQAEVVIKGLVELAPTVARLAPGDTLWFTASGGTGPYTWQVGTSGSYSVSGDTKRCLYTAGALADQYAVKATDSAARSFTARVIVTASVGRAVIVVGGGLVDSNRQVEALNHLGNFAYETLLSRGFSRDQIYYLNPDPYQNYDGDGDGYLDDFDCAPGATIGCKPSTAHLRYALTDWADTGFGTSNPRVGPGVPLYVYLVDHGGADGFLLNYSSPTTPDVVSAASVDGWLDGVQAGTTVVVVYDACYSGSFMDELGAGGAHRIVVSSAGLNESAYFGVGGLVSFSQFFWQGARQGLSVKGSFDAASLALAAWSGQHPQLDDNGTGAYETEGVKDGAAAATAYLGAAFVPGALVPALAAMGDTVLDGTTHTLLYTGVQNVQSYEVAAVYGLLTPPGYAPPRSAGDYQTPGLDDAAGLPLPRIYLEYNGGSGQWEHTLTVAETAALFPVNGRYTLTLYSQDREGEVSARADVVLTIFGPDPYEVDDAWMEGTTIEVDAANAQAHNAHDALDADWVHFAVLAGGTYKVYTSNLGDRSDTELWLYGPAAGGTNPGPLAAYDDDSGGGPSGRASMVFTHLDVGTYYVKVDQYAGATVFGEGTDYDLRVDRDTLAFGTLDGYITDSATGLGVYGAVVKVALGGTNYVTTTTIAGGYFEMLGNVPPGSGYAFTATKANYDPISPPTTAPQIIAGARSHKNAVLPAKAGTGVLAGTVRDGAVPLGGARLVINFQNLMSDAGGQYAVRVAAGSYSVDCRANGYTNYLAAGIAVTASNTTTHNVAMAAVDTDKDGIRDSLEVGCLNPNNPDGDGDGLCDGNTQVMNGSTVVCVKGEDLNGNGVVDPDETNPCAADSDGDGVNDRLDCGPLNPNTWNTCATCQDTDGDGWFGVCNAYAGISGPDCNDTNTNVWNQCGTCADADADGWWTGCNRYQTVLGPDCDDNVATGGPCHNTCTNFYADADADAYGNASAPVSRCAAPAGYVANSTDCNDTNTNVWNTCGTCVDADADGWFVGCNRYLTINGPDCDDNAATGAGCHNTCSNFYQDADADTYGNLSVSLSRCAAPAGYVANSADCLDTNTNVWNTCGTCVDADGDAWFVGCNRYLTINGPDCDDSVATGAGCHNTCSNFYPDSDNDAHGNPGVSLARCAAPVGYVADNTDCSDTNTNAWSKCATCVDADADGWFRDCDRYQTVSGPDCADSDTAVHPGHAEVTCDGKDNDCNPATLDAPDTDRDGLSDCAEPGYGTNPANWDSDGDHLPDGFEVANLSGHSVGEDLDPLNGADGALDFDADGISNVNEYYNNSDLWSPDPHPGPFANPACFYWGDADGDGIPAPSDLIALKLEISGVHQPYRDVLPHTFDTLDLDQDGYAAPSDLILLRLMIAGSERPGGYPSTPNAITVLSAPGAAVAVGSTTHVTVSLQGQGGGHSAGFALVFSLESGSALLVGGDGTDLSGPPGNRYDFTGPSLSLSPSTITLIPLAPGPLTLRASLPTCGAPPLGRWCSPLLSPPIIITAQ